ncbi:MAG TPA: polyphosphate kinase 2 family protein [Mycobacteriales bacterium]|nr:polyphosphate kinase 2 family protein [Mycobacteriales bacterium]
MQDRFRASGRVHLAADFDPGDTAGLTSKAEAKEELRLTIERLTDYQQRLYAQNRDALLIIFQAMDAAGKDSAIKHVMSGVNPQGVRVTSFKSPSDEELDHDYLWRCVRALPQRGEIGIFNRSHYEEVLITRVHPEILKAQQLPPVKGSIWQRRYREINDFERHLVDNGTHVLKFFLNVSKNEQRKRFLARIDTPAKNWKFSAADVQERERWDDYQQAYEKMLTNTSTEYAPWYVIPADHKWFTRLAVGTIIDAELDEINPRFPTVSKAAQEELAAARKRLEAD